MYLNTLPEKGEARRPRGMVKLNGQPATGWVEFEIDNNALCRADTFKVVFAASGLPKDRDGAWLTRQADLTVELLAGFPKDPTNYDASELVSYIIGRVDDVDVDPVRNVITLSGRDFTSQFIDSVTSETFTNQSASQIAKTLAARHNMTCETVDTREKVGSFYQIDHARMSTERSEWDLLTWLAQETGYSAWVTGTTLHFMPLADPDIDSKYRIRWVPPAEGHAAPLCNVERLHFARNLTLSKDIVVTVRSFNNSTGKTVVKTAKAQHNKNKVTRNATMPYGQAQRYVRSFPGLTPQKAQEKANALLKYLSKHEMRMEATLPGDSILDTRVLVQVEGTGTAFDQVYWPESIVRSLSIHEGFKMELHAKNHSPESQVSV